MKVQKQITKEWILERVSSYDIYRFYLGDFPVNRAFCNPIRGEQNPSMVVSNKNGDYMHIDFGNYFYRGDCFSLVMQIKGCSFSEALEDISVSMGLRHGKVLKSSVITWEQPKITPKIPPLIQITTRNPTKEELSYWNDYFQDISDLKRENIMFPKNIYRNRKKLPMKKNELVFCYFYPDVEKWKIYRPFAQKRTKTTPPQDWKWDTNLDYHYVEDLKSINNCNTALLTKSKKDRLVLRKALEIECIASVQAENPACLLQEDLEYFIKNSVNRITIADNDKQGKEFSWWLTNNYGFKHCNVPDNLKSFDGTQKLKDFAEVGKNYGLEAIFNHFHNKKII